MSPLMANKEINYSDNRTRSKFTNHEVVPMISNAFLLDSIALMSYIDCSIGYELDVHFELKLG